MEPPPMSRDPTSSHETNPLDVIADLRDIEWKLTLRYDPAGQELKRALAEMIARLSSGEISAQEARRHVSDMRNATGPEAFGPGFSGFSGFSGLAAPVSSPSTLKKDNLMKRASVLCEQISEAFPDDAIALGCQKRIHDDFEAETVINTVCERLRYSVPSVTPEQFGCPIRARNHL